MQSTSSLWSTISKHYHELNWSKPTFNLVTNHLGCIEHYLKGKRRGSAGEQKLSKNMITLKTRLFLFFFFKIKVYAWLVSLNNKTKTYSVIKPYPNSNIVLENINWRKTNYCTQYKSSIMSYHPSITNSSTRSTTCVLSL